MSMLTMVDGGWWKWSAI